MALTKQVASVSTDLVTYTGKNTIGSTYRVMLIASGASLSVYHRTALS